MANMTVLDGLGVARFLASIGAGTNGDPFIMERGMMGYRSADGTFQPLRLDKATDTLQTYPPGREWRLGGNMPLLMDLDGANQCNYNVDYFVEAV